VIEGKNPINVLSVIEREKLRKIERLAHHTNTLSTSVDVMVLLSA
jgi:hypothetical protein